MARKRMVLNADKTHLMLLRTDNKTRSAGDTHVTMSTQCTDYKNKYRKSAGMLD